MASRELVLLLFSALSEPNRHGVQSDRQGQPCHAWWERSRRQSSSQSHGRCTSRWQAHVRATWPLPAEGWVSAQDVHAGTGGMSRLCAEPGVGLGLSTQLLGGGS